MAKKETPLMQQYWSIKNDHKDKILLFRMGDFFEMFHEDAKLAAPILNIALTQRNKKSEDDTPMCGVPHHSIAVPIGKLLAAGYKVAICDQIEDPKEAKGIVKRAVTRILSPGMVYDPETLDAIETNYLCAYDEHCIAFLESSTGESFYFPIQSQSEKLALINSLNPIELVLLQGQKEDTFNGHVTIFEKAYSGEIPEPAQRLLNYAVHMQGEEILKSLRPFEQRQIERRFLLSPTVIRHLEIFETYKGEKRGSLFNAVNRTKTSAGARLLKNWLTFPLADKELIDKRLNQVEKWEKDPARLKELRKVFGGMGDIERRLVKIANPNCNPRDLLALADSLTSGTLVSQIWQSKEDFSVAEDVIQKVSRVVEEEAPISLKKGGVVKRGLNADLDELIDYAENSQRRLVEMEAKEKESTGIPSLKIRYNNVFGYYIEVTKTHSDKVPDHYKRKQTLTNAERYLTQELQELEEKILSARSKRVEKEEQIFKDLRGEILNRSGELLKLARLWSALDVFSSLAWLALEQNYVRPSFSENDTLNLVASRHPVVEQEMPGEFVPNNMSLSSGECLLLTGPNMAGKSTIMRQVSIVSLLAQMGSYVPAKKAELPIFEQMFTRIGASDYLAEGLSTFMVEMKEAANILNQTNNKTLVILDEIGRGTSTYDGMSLAQAILEELVTNKGSMVLFATHYHELTELDRRFSKIHNVHMAIHDDGGSLKFLHTLANGPANKSYGIHVAKLAGLPDSVTKRANSILQSMESKSKTHKMNSDIPEDLPLFSMQSEDSHGKIYKSLGEELKGLKVPSMTPLEALNFISKWQKDLEV